MMARQVPVRFQADVLMACLYPTRLCAVIASMCDSAPDACMYVIATDRRLSFKTPVLCCYDQLAFDRHLLNVLEKGSRCISRNQGIHRSL